MSRLALASGNSTRITWIILAAILLAGAALRASYLKEIAGTPEFTSPLADPAFHDYWARAILSGDWTPPAGEENPRIAEVPFQRPPGYPYFLALAYALTGKSYLGARIVQMILGLGAAVLAFFLGRALFSRAVGLLLAAFCATYWVFIYFEGELHAPVLITAFNLALLLALVRWAQRPTALRAVVAGVLLGVGALIQSTTLLFAPVGGAWMAIAGRKLGARATRDALAFLAAAVVAVAPATIRNWVVAKDFVVISSNGAINLFIGNNEEADGVSVRIPDLQEMAWMSGWSWFSYDRIVGGMSLHEGRPLKYSEASRIFTKKAFDFIRENPKKFAELCVKRAALFWGPVEVANNRAIQVDKDRSPTLKRLPGFPLALSLSLAGLLALVWERRRVAAENRAVWRDAALVAIVLFILTFFLSFVPFLAAARFRVPIIPIVFIFAAYGLVRFAQALHGRAWKPAAVALVAWVGILFACRHSFYESGPDEAWWHTDRAASLVQEGKLEEAVSELEEALRANPGYVDALVNLGGTMAELGRYDEAIARYQDVLKHRPDRADIRLRLGTLFIQTGKHSEAVKELEQVAQANPTSALAQFELGRALIEDKRETEGIEALRRSLEIDPKQPAAYVNIGISLAAKGEHEKAIEAFRSAIGAGEVAPDAHLQLGHSYRAIGKTEEAEKEYLEAFRQSPESVQAPVGLGNLYLTEKRNEDAARWYARAIGIDPRNMSARCNLAGALANQGKYEEAVTELEAALRIDPNHPIATERLKLIRQYLQSTGGATGTAASP
jgi:tetratricopeptide (TPR) repeat protein